MCVLEKSLNRSLEEKRKMYACGERFHTLDDVLTWPQYYESETHRNHIQAYFEKLKQG